MSRDYPQSRGPNNYVVTDQIVRQQEEIESLRQQLASRDAEIAELREQVTLLRDAILKRMSSENRWPDYIIEALAATEQAS